MPAGVEVKLEQEDEEFEEELMTTGLQLAGGELAHMCLVVSHLVHVSGGKSSGTCVWW